MNEQNDLVAEALSADEQTRLDELEAMQTALEQDADAEGMSWAEVSELDELRHKAGTEDPALAADAES